MIAFPHVNCNSVISPPVGLEHKVMALPVMQANDVIFGNPVICSFWRPTPQELAALASGAPIMLTVMGKSMPPVKLEVYGL